MTLKTHLGTDADQRPRFPTGLLIGGRVVEGRAARIPVTNPATGEVITEVSGANEQDIDDAVGTANDAFRNGVWRTMPIHDRAQLIHRFADGIEAQMTGLYELETMNNGPPCCSPTGLRWSRYAASTTPTPAGSRWAWSASSRRSTIR